MTISMTYSMDKLALNPESAQTLLVDIPLGRLISQCWVGVLLDVEVVAHP